MNSHKSDTLAPIAIFVYKRPKHIRNLLDSLIQCEEAGKSDLIIFSDGPKDPKNSSEVEAIEEVRTICLEEKRFKSVRLISREKNQGLANSIIKGVTQVVDEYGRVIVLEDDLVVSPYFLQFMNQALTRFESDPRVGSIGGCNFFACGDRFPSAFFIPIPDCLGWATWKKNWDKFIRDPHQILSTLEGNKKLTHRFNGNGSYDFVGLLKSNMERKVDSWAILWHATCILNEWLALYPNASLTNHKESMEATHANVNITPPLADLPFDLSNVEVKEIPEVIRAMKLGYAGQGDYFGNPTFKSNLWQRFVNWLKK